MKTMGIIGGMSWKSTQFYYQVMNEYIHDLKGGYWSIEALIYSINFAKIQDLLTQNRWDDIATTLVDLACKLEQAGQPLFLCPVMPRTKSLIPLNQNSPSLFSIL